MGHRRKKKKMLTESKKTYIHGSCEFKYYYWYIKKTLKTSQKQSNLRYCHGLLVDSVSFTRKLKKTLKIVHNDIVDIESTVTGFKGRTPLNESIHTCLLLCNKPSEVKTYKFTSRHIKIYL